MALPTSLTSLYCAIIAALVFRAVQYPAVPPPPVLEPPKCTWDWKRFRCSAGCMLRLPQGCKPVAVEASAAPSAAPASRSADTSRADSLMRRRSVANCLAAADIFEAAAETAVAGTAAKLQLKAADAINCAMRIETNGNIMVLEGTVDTIAAKKFWGMHGPRALRLVRAAKKDPTLAAEAWLAATEMDAFMFSSSAKGIISQAVTGAGSEFQKLANVLVARHTAWDSGVGRCYLAGFYNIAPWPLGDKKRALAEVMLSLGKHPASRRNNYYACMMNLQQGARASAPETAVGYCEAALRASCVGQTEPDYCAFLTSETQRVLTAAKAAGK